MKHSFVKRAISVLLVVGLLATFAVVPVFAADENTPAAMIGETPYDTLTEAIEKAASGATIELQRDVEESDITFQTAGEYTLKLNGYKLSTTAADSEIIAVKASDVTLNIQNGKLYSEAENTYGIYVYNQKGGNGFNNVTVTLDQVELTCKAQALGVPGMGSNDNLKLINSKVTTESCGIYFPPVSGTLEIDNSTVTAKTNALVLKGGQTVIRGENTLLSATGEKGEQVSGYPGGSTGFPATGDAIYMEGGYTASDANRAISLTIEGGTIDSANADAIRTQFTKAEDENQTITITGGKLNDGITNAGDNSLTISGADTQIGGNIANNGNGSVSITDAAVSGNVSNAGAGTAILQNASVSGTVTGSETGSTRVVECTVGSVTQESNVLYLDSSTSDGTAIENTVVAAIGDVWYTTLQDAVNAAGETPTEIKLMAAAAGKGVVVQSGQNITFDLNTYTYTVNEGVGSKGTETNCFQLLRDSNVTIKNGTIAADSSKYPLYIMIQNYSNLKLENVRLDGTGLQDDPDEKEYTLSNNNGEIVLNAGTVIDARAEGENAMDVCWASSYPDGARVTMNDGVTLNGNLELGLWGQSAYDDEQSVLTVNGGVINGEVTLDRTVTEDQIDQTNESLRSNITINGGTFGSDVSVYIDSEEEARAMVARSNDTYSYYQDVETAQANLQSGDTLVVISQTEQYDTVTLDLGYGEKQMQMKVPAGTTISLPDPGTRYGYTFDGWYLDQEKVENYTASEAGGENVTISAVWTQNALPFTDVPEDAWFYENVGYVLSRGLMVGTTETTFGPESYTTRGMMVATLYRLAEKPEVSGECPFSDVPEGAYYEDAIIWAQQNGIVSGYSADRFGPNDQVTREQVAAFLYRYAKYKGCDVSGSADLSAFEDANLISNYAKPALSWANANGLIYGRSDSLLDPNGSTERSEMAAFLHRFCEKFAQ